MTNLINVILVTALVLQSSASFAGSLFCYPWQHRTEFGNVISGVKGNSISQLSAFNSMVTYNKFSPPIGSIGMMSLLWLDGTRLRSSSVDLFSSTGYQRTLRTVHDFGYWDLNIGGTFTTFRDPTSQVTNPQGSFAPGSIVTIGLGNTEMKRLQYVTYNPDGSASKIGNFGSDYFGGYSQALVDESNYLKAIVSPIYDSTRYSPKRSVIGLRVRTNVNITSGGDLVVSKGGLDQDFYFSGMFVYPTDDLFRSSVKSFIFQGTKIVTLAIIRDPFYQKVYMRKYVLDTAQGVNAVWNPGPAIGLPFSFTAGLPEFEVAPGSNGRVYLAQGNTVYRIQALLSRPKLEIFLDEAKINALTGGVLLGGSNSANKKINRLWISKAILGGDIAVRIIHEETNTVAGTLYTQAAFVGRENDISLLIEGEAINQQKLKNVAGQALMSLDADNFVAMQIEDSPNPKYEKWVDAAYCRRK